jgi:hypothetical protein
MGQFITVTARAGSSPSVRIFDLNRSLTGMAIERYSSAADVNDGDHRPPAVLAKRLFDLGVTSVTVYSSAVAVVAPGDLWPTLESTVIETIEHLFGFYGDDAGWSPDSLRAIGVEPLPILFEAPQPSA